jgi:hypothetical protein
MAHLVDERGTIGVKDLNFACLQTLDVQKINEQL